MSKYHEKTPYQFELNSEIFQVRYVAAESEMSMFGGNSNWRGPIWFPVNFLLIDSLLKFYQYYGDDFEIEYPTNSGHVMSVKAGDCAGYRTAHQHLPARCNRARLPPTVLIKKMQDDPHFQGLYLFYEYFNGDNGMGLGANHQTGWTGLVADLIEYLYKYQTQPHELAVAAEK